jgi:hypothetical protein
MRQRWTNSESHEIGPTGDELIWREYPLGLLINRHCAKFWDDEIVSQELRNVSRTQKLPWEI